MKKKIFLFIVGVMMGLSATGCGSKHNDNHAESMKSVESAEISLESSLESTEAQKETEKVVETPVPTPAPTPAPGLGDCCTIHPPEVTEEEILDIVDQESAYVIKAEGNEWIDYSEDFEFPEVPYKEKLDEMIGNDLETGYGFSWDWEKQDDEYYYKWIDCGMYYKVKDIDIVSFYDSETGGMDFDIIAHFDELYIMKEGEFNHSGKVYTVLDEWIERSSYIPPRFELKFNEKGYIVGFMDVFAS